jgi:hypothetical protein
VPYTLGRQRTMTQEAVVLALERMQRHPVEFDLNQLQPLLNDIYNERHLKFHSDWSPKLTRFQKTALETLAEHTWHVLKCRIDDSGAATACVRCVAVIGSNAGPGFEKNWDLLAEVMRRHAESPEVCKVSVRFMQQLKYSPERGACVAAIFERHSSNKSVCKAVAKYLCNVTETTDQGMRHVDLLMHVLDAHTSEPSVIYSVSEALTNLARVPINREGLLCCLPVMKKTFLTALEIETGDMDTTVKCVRFFVELSQSPSTNAALLASCLPGNSEMDTVTGILAEFKREYGTYHRNDIAEWFGKPAIMDDLDVSDEDVSDEDASDEDVSD